MRATCGVLYLLGVSGMEMDSLMKQYRVSLRKVQQALMEATEDRLALEGMASDLRFALEWMTTGRRPGNRRGIERRAAYQREIPLDPLKIQSYVVATTIQSGAISKADRERLEDALSVLTDREREVYLMSRGQCLSYAEIAAMLFVCKSTVQETVERAEKKIAKRIHESLFCLCG